MAKKTDLFYILKLNVSTIINNNFQMTKTFDEFKKLGDVVSIGDNQILKFIRDIKCIDFDKQKNKLSQLYKNRNDLKSKEKSYESSQRIYGYQKEIDKILYIPEIISVHANTTKKQYKKIANNKFTINGITYKRLCAGAGQLRRNTVFFVDEKYYDQLTKIMMCGLDKKRIGKINLAKFSAYHSLYASCTNLISTPKVCVVKDYELLLKGQNIDWIFENKNGERDIETKKIDILQNVWDGSGLVSIEMSKEWEKDLNIDDYSPSAYIIRSAWIKGLCVVFDWKRFAREIAHKDYIIDAWGNKKNINDIDVILSTSQFKMWKKYDNWEEYLKYHSEYGHVWGCSRANKKKDNFLTPLNYQYIQSNNFSSDNIKKLADFSIDWIKKVTTGERIYVLLYLLGCHEADKNINEIEKDTGMNIVKALLYDETILNDTYVRNRIYKSIEKKINQLKIGKLLCEGSYEFAIIDPYMFCEYIFGFSNPKGLLKEGQLWNQRWVNKNSKEVVIMRSPLVSPHENQVLEVYSDDRCINWFSNIKSGIILNGWDTSLMRASDADTDGDLLLSSNNKYLISSVDRSLNPITYEKSMVKEQSLTYNNLAKMDTKSFNTKIGFITNLATSFFCLRERYSKDSKEYKELTKRINLLRFHQGSAIDAGKGNLYISPPKHWSKKAKIDYVVDSEEVKKNKYYINKLVGDKKSYFMCYIYPSLMKAYKQHKESGKRICRAMFGCKIEEILRKKIKTDKEKKFSKNYYKYIPTLMNKSIMNELCWYIEDLDFDLKFFKSKIYFDYKKLMSSNTINIQSNLYQRVLIVLEKYHYIYELNVNERKNMIDNGYSENTEEENNDEFSILFNEIENELYKVCSNKSDLCDYIVYIMYNEFKNKSKAIMWNICGKEIVQNIKEKSNKAVFPIECDDSQGVKYLGKYYKLQEVENIGDI